MTLRETRREIADLKERLATKKPRKREVHHDTAKAIAETTLESERPAKRAVSPPPPFQRTEGVILQRSTRASIPTQQSLNVLMQGEPLAEQLNTAGIVTPESAYSPPASAPPDKELSDGDMEWPQRELKPAILPAIGTVNAPVFSTKPTPKPRYEAPPPMKPVPQVPTGRLAFISSARSNLTGASEDSVTAVEQLVNEAMELSRAIEDQHPMKKKKSKAASTKENTNSGKTETSVKNYTRSVDEIIASLGAKEDRSASDLKIASLLGQLGLPVDEFLPPPSRELEEPTTPSPRQRSSPATGRLIPPPLSRNTSSSRTTPLIDSRLASILDSYTRPRTAEEMASLTPLDMDEEDEKDDLFIALARLPSAVSHEDVVGVLGEKIQFTLDPPKARRPRPPKVLKAEHSMHNLCMNAAISTDGFMGFDAQRVAMEQFVPTKYHIAPTREIDDTKARAALQSPEPEQPIEVDEELAVWREAAEESIRTQNTATQSLHVPTADGEEMSFAVAPMTLQTGTKAAMTNAPMKLLLNPEVVASSLFPHYASSGDVPANAHLSLAQRDPFVALPALSKREKTADAEWLIQQRLISNKMPSLVDLSTPSELSLVRRRSSFVRRRRGSAPPVLVRRDTLQEAVLAVPQKYADVMSEVGDQRARLRSQLAAAKKRAKEDAQKAAEEEERLAKEKKEKPVVAFPETVSGEAEDCEEGRDKEAPLPAPVEREEDRLQRLRAVVRRPTTAELARSSSKPSANLKRLKPKKRRKRVTEEHLDWVVDAITEEGRELERSESVIRLAPQLEWTLRVPLRVRRGRRHSADNRLVFEKFGEMRGRENGEPLSDKDWVRDVWSQWFDQRYPPGGTTTADTESSEGMPDFWADADEEQPAESKVLPSVEDLEEKVEAEDSHIVLKQQLEQLDEMLDANVGNRAVHLTRRGAIRRKLGMLKGAISDLDEALDIESTLVDAYWHRHFIHLVQGDEWAALEDLTKLLRLKRNHPGAHLSRADILRGQGDINEAIQAYGAAIRYDGQNAEAFFKRAQCYEERGDVLLAMEDYTQSNYLNPENTEALMKHAMHYYEKQEWLQAITDFSAILKRRPSDVSLLMLRAKAHAALQNWQEAVSDISFVIHLKPDEATAFFYRGCLIRKLYPTRAIQDFSVAILLDPSPKAIPSLLHRGICYQENGCIKDAINDFEHILRLDRSMAAAHVNLGLIAMLQQNNPYGALRKFGSAIRADPTYIQAYICRAEANCRVRLYDQAARDFSRAIHLCPTDHSLYVHRGYVTMKAGQYSLASYCIRQATEMQDGVGQGTFQKAIVQSFLKNFDKAIEILQETLRYKPNVQTYTMLGKILMKSGRFTEALPYLDLAIERLRPGNTYAAWPKQASSIHFSKGQCCTSINQLPKALEAFNLAIKINPNSADAWYQRGLTKFLMKKEGALKDVNRSLAVDPTLFQAFLTRAAFYGMNGGFAKAILNCTEAIKIKPKSVRAYLYRGSLKYAARLYPAAVLDLSEAIKHDKSCALAYLNRAICHYVQRHYPPALRDYSCVLLLDQRHAFKVYVNRGLLYFERGDYANALADFAEAATRQPEDLTLQHALALCYHKQNFLRRAVLTHSRAIAGDQFFVESYIGRANVLMDFHTQEAIEYAQRDYTRVLHIRPRNLAARVNLGLCLQAQEKYMLAWKQLTIAIETHPSNALSWECRAVVNLQMKNLTGAHSDLTVAIQKQKSAFLYNNRGVVNMHLGHVHQAMRDFKTALTVDPRYSLSYYNAANMYLRHRQFKQALDFYNRALIFDASNETALINRAIARVIQEDKEGALEDLDAAEVLAPFAHHIPFNRGNVLLLMGRADDALPQFERAVELQPDDPLLLKCLGDCVGALGRREEAVALYKRSVSFQSVKQGEKGITSADF